MFDWIKSAAAPERTYEGFERMETSFADVNVGLATGTKVATKMGWRPVETIAAGDMVLTFDGGMQPVVEVRRFTVWSTHHDKDPSRWPLNVPAGALGNQDRMTILPDQPVMIESDAAENIYGDAFALMAASALEGFRGIERIAPPCRTDVVCIYFSEDQIVFSNGGALFLCQAAVDILVGIDPQTNGYVALSDAQADILVSLMELDETGFGVSSPKGDPGSCVS
ncbi:Hint domain-containing protein [Aestuariibius sp. HNIBRBA575]|uniref:Hint domain-containing protein n=1 Tax=Aestuariibius sp. HNIBRBA575 TaxID=3233343 RepID=UPI0034A175BA